MESVSSSFSAALIHNGTKNIHIYLLDLYSDYYNLMKTFPNFMTSSWDSTTNPESTYLDFFAFNKNV